MATRGSVAMFQNYETNLIFTFFGLYCPKTRNKYLNHFCAAARFQTSYRFVSCSTIQTWIDSNLYKSNFHTKQNELYKFAVFSCLISCTASLYVLCMVMCTWAFINSLLRFFLTQFQLHLEKAFIGHTAICLACTLYLTTNMVHRCRFCPQLFWE